jgi:hypothetical protein
VRAEDYVREGPGIRVGDRSHRLTPALSRCIG